MAYNHKQEVRRDDAFPFRRPSSSQSVPREARPADTHDLGGDGAIAGDHPAGQESQDGAGVPIDSGDFVPLLWGAEHFGADGVRAERRPETAEQMIRVDTAAGPWYTSRRSVAARASGGMADTLVLGTSAARRRSSTLLSPTQP